jgi:hypothetical protein
MAISAFDRRLYTFQCPNCRVIEAIPIGRLVAFSITCAACGVAHDLNVEPYLTTLKHEFALAQEEDDELRKKDEPRKESS